MLRKYCGKLRPVGTNFGDAGNWIKRVIGKLSCRESTVSDKVESVMGEWCENIRCGKCRYVGTVSDKLLGFMEYVCAEENVGSVHIFRKVKAVLNMFGLKYRSIEVTNGMKYNKYDADI